MKNPDRTTSTTGVSENHTQSDSTKKLANLKACAALAGVALVETEGDHGRPIYIVSRWNLTRELPDLDAAERWLDLVTGVRS